MRSCLSLAAFLTLGMVQVHAADPPAPAPSAPGKTIEVAICLDISGSMDGLIESAKIKLWTIVNDLAKIEPTPTLRVALYSYGCDAYDPKKGWVVKDCDLTQDLDEIYRKLNGFRTNGGTELVARVCRDAIRDLKWCADNDALRLIFVCGNEPADQDKEVLLNDVATEARKQGIFINTIYCGPAANAEANGWREFAASAGGKYSNIDQDRARSAVVINTPFDKELVALGEKLNTTYCCYGMQGRGKAENQSVQDQNAAKAAPTVAVERAATKASKLYRCDTWDLVDRMKNDKSFDLAKLKDEELPEELRKLKAEERVAYVKKKGEERAELQKKLNELNEKRARFIAEETKKLPKTDSEKAFDDAVRSIVREQAATKGIVIPQ